MNEDKQCPNCYSMDFEFGECDNCGYEEVIDADEDSFDWGVDDDVQMYGYDGDCG